MFSGIIETTAKVITFAQTGRGGAKLVIDAKAFASKLKKGDSIAVNGVCLTVARKQGRRIGLDLSPETLQRTNLGLLQPEGRVNLEPSLTPNSAVNGHFVQGHAEGVGTVKKWIRNGDDARLFVKLPPNLVEFCIAKGSIAINGVSLTIASLEDAVVGIALIPYTLKHTNLGDLRPGDPVNIETDMLGRYVVTTVKKAYHSLNLPKQKK